MGLDVLTKKGKKALSDERKAMSAFFNKFSFKPVETPKNKPAICDGLLFSWPECEMKAVYEVKCRYDVDDIEFFCAYDGEWLVSEAKLKGCKNLADGLGVDFVGFLYLAKSSTLLWKVIDNWKTKKTYTSKTVNNSQVVEKDNGFIDMRDAKCISDVNIYA